MGYKKQSDYVKVLLKKLEEGVETIFTSENYKEYLKTMSQFHQYSILNSYLIALQNPYATRVAGYATWEKQFNRHVKKGEKGLEVLAPYHYTQKIEKTKTNPITKEVLKDGNGHLVVESVEVEHMCFKIVHVFDIAQTEGSPLVSLVGELSGTLEYTTQLMEAIKKIAKVPIRFDAIPGQIKGYYDRAKPMIVIQEGMSDIQTVEVAIHELVHSRLHSLTNQRIGGDVTVNTEEVEAESVAFAVCQYFKIDTSNQSFGYVTAWSSTKKLKELKQSLETIQKEACKLIDAIEQALT